MGLVWPGAIHRLDDRPWAGHWQRGAAGASSAAVAGPMAGTAVKPAIAATEASAVRRRRERMTHPRKESPKADPIRPSGSVGEHG